MGPYGHGPQVFDPPDPLSSALLGPNTCIEGLYGDHDSSFDLLFSQGITVHQKNPSNFVIEIDKTMNRLNPSYIWEFYFKTEIATLQSPRQRATGWNR